MSFQPEFRQHILQAFKDGQGNKDSG